MTDLILALALFCAPARADIAPEPGSPEALALAKEEAKTCQPGETMVVCGVRAGVNWHPVNCEKYENDLGYYQLKSFKYEQAYCKYPPGKSRPAPKPLPAPEEKGLPVLTALGVASAMAVGGFILWMIRRRRA